MSATLFFLLICLTPSLTAQIADDPVGRAFVRWKAGTKAMREQGKPPSRENLGTAADEALRELNIEGLSLAQLERLIGDDNVTMYTSRRAELRKTLSRHAAKPNDEGALAAVLMLNVLGDAAVETQKAAVGAMVNHPRIGPLLRRGRPWTHIAGLRWSVRTDAIRGLEPVLVKLGEHLPDDVPIMGVLGAVGLFDKLAAAEPGGYRRREPLRSRLVEVLRKVEKRADPNDPSIQGLNIAANIKSYLRGQIKRLDGPTARGTLVGGPAPELNFIWSSDGKLKKLSDLKGRVVVLDFWATWCGPCVASFPKVRELVAHYEGKAVTVIGVTSVQGSHSGPEGPIDCSDDEQKEFALMREFMKQKDMTWPVAFSKEPVYNPAYGIRGIPHVTIIDPAGVVRFNNLHPSTPLEEKTSKIDALLTEFKR